MVSLILLVCLVSSPETCQEERPPVEVASSLSCVIEGQLIAAEWLEEHPKWALKGWRCRLGAPEKST
jgi:hypothetical protein